MRKSLTAMRGLNLGFLGSLYCDSTPWKLANDFDKDEAADAYGQYTTDDWDNLQRYNAEDSLRTAQIGSAMVGESEWLSSRVQALYAQHVETSRIAGEMHRTGFYFRADERVRLSAELREEYHRRCEKVQKLVYDHDPSFTLRLEASREGALPKLRDGDLRKLTYEVFGLPVLGRTPTGVPTVNRNNLLLQFLRPETPTSFKQICLAWWAADSLFKGKSTFVDSEDIDEAIWADGRVHAMWNSCGADTGRWACRKPSLQVLAESKSESDGDLTGNQPNYRRLYGAAPGKILVHADWSQLELYLFVAIAGDTVLQADMASGDAHSAAAKAWFGLSDDAPIEKSVRRSAKEINYSGAYGAEAPTMHIRVLRRQIFITESKVDWLRRKMLLRRPRMRGYWSDEAKRVEDSGNYSETRIMCRRRQYAERPGVPELANYPIQGTAADLANCAIVDIARELLRIPEARLVTQVHDAFDVECLPRDEARVTQILKDAMQRPYWIEGKQWSFPVDVHVGGLWSEV